MPCVQELAGFWLEHWQHPSYPLSMGHADGELIRQHQTSLEEWAGYQWWFLDHSLHEPSAHLYKTGKPKRRAVESTGVAEIYGRKLFFDDLYVFLDFGKNFPPPSFCIVPTWRIARKYTHITYEALHSSVNTTAIWLSIIAPVMTIRKRRRRAFDWYVLLYLTKFKSFPLISTALLLGFPVLYEQPLWAPVEECKHQHW